MNCDHEMSEWHIAFKKFVDLPISKKDPQILVKAVNQYLNTKINKVILLDVTKLEKLRDQMRSRTKRYDQIANRIAKTALRANKRKRSK